MAGTVEQASRRVVVVWLAVVVAALALTATLLGRSVEESGSWFVMSPEERVANLREAVGEESSRPLGAVLDAERVFEGMNSDAPSIAWSYRFDGSPSDFADHYARTLPRAGWREAPVPQGFASNGLGLFRRDLGRSSYELMVWNDVFPNREGDQLGVTVRFDDSHP